MSGLVDRSNDYKYGLDATGHTVLRDASACCETNFPLPLSSECGTRQTVKARFWPWLAGEVESTEHRHPETEREKERDGEGGRGRERER